MVRTWVDFDGAAITEDGEKEYVGFEGTAFSEDQAVPADGVIMVPRRRRAIGNRAPLVPQLNNSHSLIRGAQSLGFISRNDGSVGAWDFRAKQRLLPFNNSPSLISSSFGPSLQFNDASRIGETLLVSHLGNTWLDGATSFTLSLLCRLNGPSNAAEDSLIGQWQVLQGDSSNQARRVFIRYDSLNDEFDMFLFTTTQVSMTSIAANSFGDGDFHWVIARYDSANLTIWQDAVLLGTQAETGVLQSAVHSKVPEISGGHNTTGTASQGDSPRIDIKAWGMWGRGITDGEIYALSNPQTRWGLFQQKALSLFPIITSFTSTAALVLPSLAQSASAVLRMEGVGVQTAPSLLQAANGLLTISATATQLMPSLEQVASGLEILLGAGSQDLPSMVQAAVGAVVFEATGIMTLPSLEQVANAIEEMTGTAALLLPALIQAGVGSHVPLGSSGTGVQTLPTIGQIASALVISFIRDFIDLLQPADIDISGGPDVEV